MKPKRFRANPVEILIFVAVSGIFLKSVYGLVYEPQEFAPNAVRQIAANPLFEGRTPSSTQERVRSIDFDKCDPNLPDQEVAASKIRINGRLCGTDVKPDRFVTATVVNTANKFRATVFPDVPHRVFSTDYIPLNSGKNPIRVEYSYRDGEVASVDFNIIKN